MRSTPRVAAGCIALIAFLAACSESAAPDTTAPPGVSSATAGAGPTTGNPPPALPRVGPIAPTLTPVGPGPEHPLIGIDRDIGISVELSDGSRLWLFGDTAARDSSGRLTYFEVGTGAWAPADSPTETRDFARDGEPVPLVAEPSGRPPCPPEAPETGVWPVAAITDPRDPDRVLVWMVNICLGSATVVRPQGISLAEWRYDPSRPPEDAPVQLTVLNPLIFDSEDVVGSVIEGDGRYLIVVGCRPPELMGWGRTPGSRRPPVDGACAARRVDVADVADPAAYVPWTGTQWSDGEPAELELPPPPGPIELPAAPVGPFSVAPAPSGGGVVMVYSPWPGYVPALAVRWASTITGPWSAPVTVPLRECDPQDDPRRSCYAANAQPDFSTPDELGIGYYDREVSTPPQRGAFLIGSVPFRAPQSNG